MFVQKLRSGCENSGRAKPALQGMMLAESHLQIVQFAIVSGKPLDGSNDCALDLRREYQARPDRAPIDQHRARPANAVLAAHMRTVLLENMAEKIGKLHTGLCLGLHRLSVQRKVDGRLGAGLYLKHKRVPSRSTQSWPYARARSRATAGNRPRRGDRSDSRVAC